MHIHRMFVTFKGMSLLSNDILAHVPAAAPAAIGKELLPVVAPMDGLIGEDDSIIVLVDRDVEAILVVDDELGVVSLVDGRSI